MVLCSCGDDGRVRGWKWKEFGESESSLHLQGVYTIFLVSDIKEPFFFEFED